MEKEIRVKIDSQLNKLKNSASDEEYNKNICLSVSFMSRDYCIELGKSKHIEKGFWAKLFGKK